MNTEYHKIRSIETENINLISDWYYNEWRIPKQQTVESLSSNSCESIIFQILMTENKTPIGTGGLYNKVGIQNRIEKYKNFSPWIALMFTKPEIRGKGLGGKLLNKIEQEAQKKGFKKIYLFTHSAESLYKRQGWNEIDRYNIEEKNIVIMEKGV